MMSFRRTVFLLMMAMSFVGVSLRAQPAPGGGTNSPKSPVALFRELLAMSPQERREAIAIRPQETQNRILEKLNEYEILPNELREVRLRETELRWYLRPLMDEARTNRPAILARIPEELRGEVAERLRLWDLLPPDLQEQWKDNDLIASYFAQARNATPAQREEILRQISFSPERLDDLKKEFDRWQAMSETDRQRAVAGFNKFFELTPNQKEKTLDSLSDDERQQIEQTLASYQNLTPKQRAQCISSFEKFARMSVAERQQFLKNAEQWRDMTPEERQKWRQLVIVAPILPPNLPPQPLPTNRTGLRGGTTVAGN